MYLLDNVKNKLNAIKNLLSKIDINKIDKFSKNLFGAIPNGFLGEIPLVVLSTDYTQDNEITGYKSYLKDSFNENMFVNTYTLKVECILYGLTWKSELESLVNRAKDREYTIFYYTKMEKAFVPVAISNISYNEDYQSSTTIKVSFTLKEINLLQFTENEDGTTTTNAYNPTINTQNRELVEVNQSNNLINAMVNDVRTSGVFG